MRLKRIVKRGALVLLLAVVLVATVAWFRSSNDCESARTVPRFPMQAIRYCEYGTADALSLETIERPTFGDDQLLIKVRAASLNPLDWHYMRGTPYVMRLSTGLRKPKATHLGVDAAGVVEAVGRNVKDFKPGDEVFGGCIGAFAEYCVSNGRLAIKPANVTFEQAAAMPIAAITALQGLRDQAKVRPGQKVLINGASGGVGTFAVQLAKWMGAEVTGVCSTKNLELVRSLGADHVVDYTREDFTRSGQRYDVIMDNVGTRPLLELRRALQPDGTCILIGGGGPNDGNWIGPLANLGKAKALSPFVSQKVAMYIANLNRTDLATLADLLASGKLRPVIDRTYELREVPQAIRYLEQGHARGKVVIHVP